MAKLYVVKTKNGNFYEIEEEHQLLHKKWWIFFKGERLEIGFLENGESKKPQRISDFLGCKIRFGRMANTSRVSAIYTLKEIAN